ncbi:unnamed protein product [Polarella glacialis]|uniref:Uncharacterized protein n=1 Tax=Polarella glacialis TaxID=89957 RepID=A0A813DKM8_POLGL|nr:unnamed protein product [Polarella glacialis]
MQSSTAAEAANADCWSGARGPPPDPGGWFDGCGFWLNHVEGEEVHEDDPRLTDPERQQFEQYEPGDRDSAVFEMMCSDERSEVRPTANAAAIRLAALNHDPPNLRAAPASDAHAAALTEHVIAYTKWYCVHACSRKHPNTEQTEQIINVVLPEPLSTA